MPSSAAIALSSVSDSSGPAPIFSIATAYMPFSTMNGVDSYFVAPATCTAIPYRGIQVCGELVVSRIDRQVRKSYSYVYGVDEQGRTVYGAHFKSFPLHRMPSSCSFSAASFFGYNPLSPYRSSSGAS